MLKFYTNAPVEYQYELILFDNFKVENINLSHQYIIDSGVYNLKKHGEYNLSKYKKLNFEPIFANVDYVIPDYPSDLLGDNEENIEKTFNNIDFFFKRFKSHNLLPSIQFLTGNFNSFLKSFNRFIDLYPDIKRIAIGNMCMMRKMNFYERLERYLRPFMEQGYYFHIFGMNLRALNIFKNWKSLSWDGMKWTRPCAITKKRGFNHSCRNKKERILYFTDYIKTINNYLH